MKLDQPIRIFIPSHSEPLIFDAGGDFISWLENERDVWNHFGESVGNYANAIPNAPSYLAQNSGNWSNLLLSATTSVTNGDESGLHGNGQSVGSLLQQGQLLWSGDTLAQRAIALVSVDVNASVWVFLMGSGYAGGIANGNNAPHLWAGYFRAIAHLNDPKVAASFHRKQRASLDSIIKLVAEVKDHVRLNGEGVSKNSEELAKWLEISSE